MFTACLLGAAVLGGFIGACCSKGRQAGDHEGRIAELEDRLDALADHAMEEAKNVKARVASLEDSMDAFQTHVLEQEQAIHAELDEHEFLIGETPTGGLLGRVSALEEAQKTHEQDAVIVNGWAEEIKALKKEMDGIRMVNDAEHHALLEHQKCIVKDMQEAQGGR